MTNKLQMQKDTAILMSRRIIQARWVCKKFTASLAIVCVIPAVVLFFMFRPKCGKVLLPEKDLGFPKCEIAELRSIEQFYQKLEQVTPLCKNLTSFGGNLLMDNSKVIDGAYKVCMDPQFQLRKGNCTVISFGIADDWSFEDQMDKEFQCKVFSFDPTIGFNNHKRSLGINFYNIGLGIRDGSKSIADHAVRTKRYDSIVRSLNLQTSYIDYLKMDIEGDELQFFKEIFGYSSYLLKNIRQIGMEIHPGTVDMDEIFIYIYWAALLKLECSGFQMVSSVSNDVPGSHYILNGKPKSCCYEMLWVNTRILENDSS